MISLWDVKTVHILQGYNIQFLYTQVKGNGNIDVLIISETKINDNFPVGNFVSESFSTAYCLNHDNYGGSIILYVREDIPSNLFVTEENITQKVFMYNQVAL